MRIRAYYLADGNLTGRQALEAAGAAPFIVIKLLVGKYAVIKPDDLHQQLQLSKALDIPFNELPAHILNPYFAVAFQIIQIGPAEQERIDHLEENEFILVLSGETIQGLLTGSHHAHAINPKLSNLAGEELMPTPPQAVEEKRKINVGLRDRDNNPYDPRQKPLLKNQVYNLIFDVGLQASPDAFENDEFRYRFQGGEELVTITVRIETDDFQVYDDPQKKLFVPSQGPSKNQVVFSIEPKHDGESTITAVFLKDTNFIQVMTLKLNVGQESGFSSQTLGRDVGAAATLQPRDISLTILSGSEGYQLILSGATAAMATLRIKLLELKDMVAGVRQALVDIVNLKSNGRLIYQESIDIPEAVSQQTLSSLAEAGFRLYQRIFFGPTADLQVNNLGNKLRQLAQQEQLKIQIFSQDFVLPWGVLYMADRFDPANIQPELFLGFKHIIEHIPLQQDMQVLENKIDSSLPLSVSLNVNKDIDQAMGYPLIQGQEQYWQAVENQISTLKVQERTTKDEVIHALVDPGIKDQLIYFYCHGVTQDIGDTGGVDASALVLSGNGRLTLEDLNLSAPTTDHLSNAPLVFINACESAQISPLVYDGFVPYFMTKGARGVIGTECNVPARFAVEWANRFFNHFLKGEVVGQIFLDLRREFFNDHHNILGLLYAIYTDADTQVVPGLQFS